MEILGKVAEDLRRHHAIAAEAWVHALQAIEAHEEQARAGQENHRHCDLGDDEAALEPMAAADVADALAARLERAAEIHAGREGRKRSENQSRHHRDEQGESQDLRIEFDLARPGGEPAGEPRQHVEGGPGEGQADNAAEEREQRALGEQLPHESPSPCPERRSECQLTIAAQHARERQVRDVGTGEQQHETGRAQQNQQHLACARRQLLEHVRGARLKACSRAIDLRKVSGPSLCHGRHLGLGRVRGCSGLEKAEHLQRGEGTTIGFDVALGRRAERARRRRHVDVDLVRVVRHRRQHADHCVRAVVHLEDLADDLRVGAKLRPPVRVAKHEHRLGTMVVIRGNERPPEDGLDSQRIEEVG